MSRTAGARRLLVMASRIWRLAFDGLDELTGLADLLGTSLHRRSIWP